MRHNREMTEQLRFSGELLKVILWIFIFHFNFLSFSFSDGESWVWYLTATVFNYCTISLFLFSFRKQRERVEILQWRTWETFQVEIFKNVFGDILRLFVHVRRCFKETMQPKHITIFIGVFNLSTIYLSN